MLPLSTYFPITKQAGVGGSSADVVYVTFMSEDGLTELLKKPVAIGDDCADVIGRGLIDEPLKDSSPEFNYTHNGWSRTPGGEADSEVLLSVVEDVSVYAAFQASVRYYTVRFYDGDTLKDTVQVAYGANASCTTTLTKQDYLLAGWSPSNENITEDRDCYAEWIYNDGLIRDDWDVIAQNVNNGKSYLYPVGNTKDLEIAYTDGTTETITMRVVHHKSHNDRINSNTNQCAGIVFVSDNYLKTLRELHSNYKIYSWQAMTLYEYLNESLKPCLPETLQQSLQNINRLYYPVSGLSTTTSQLKGELWIPAIDEMDYISSESVREGNCSDSQGYNGQPFSYDYYETDSANRRIKKLYNTETSTLCHTRSCKQSSSTLSQFMIQTDGSLSRSYDSSSSTDNPTSSRGVVVSFALGAVSLD